MAQTAEERQEQKNACNRERNAKANDCAPLPAVVNQSRRDDCAKNFKAFCLTYFAKVFSRPFSAAHEQVIEAIQTAVLDGGQMANAMPRGWGKTTLCEVGSLWALVYGHRRYVMVVGATGPLAKKNLSTIKGHLETNELLAEDFPEVCHPVQRLNRTPNKAYSQTHEGEPTYIAWSKDAIVLPTIPGSVSSGGVVEVAGIDAAIRGRKMLHPATGTVIRPDLCVIDDPQTKKSARSLPACQIRLDAINADIMGLAAGSEPMAAFAAVTVIAPGDAADRLLDRKQYPQWRGRRTKMLVTLPTNTKLWEQYHELWATCLRDDDTGGDIAKATAFYVEHQAELDEGAVASWEHDFETNEASAVQHAMNKKLKDEHAFFAECQNEPVSNRETSIIAPTIQQVEAKVVKNYAQGFVPDGTLKLTAMIDVQGDVLFYAVCAWGNGFRGHVVERGTWPEQDKSYFGLRDLDHTLQQQMPTADYDGQLYNALKTLTDLLLTKKYHGNNDTSYDISRLLIDANGTASHVVKLMIKQSSHRARMIGSQGVGVGAEKSPMDNWKLKDGERRGLHWLHNVPTNHIRFNTNHWKSHVIGRLMAGNGDQGSITIFGDPKPIRLQLLIEHLTSEQGRPMLDEASGRRVVEWRMIPNRENHWLDCLVGCAVGASEQGITTETMASAAPKPKKRKALNLSWT